MVQQGGLKGKGLKGQRAEGLITGLVPCSVTSGTFSTLPARRDLMGLNKKGEFLFES